jgi:hypothetical protein
MSKPTHPLPIEARRALWTRIWDRLLAAPPDASPSPAGPTRDGRPTDPHTDPPEEDRP